MKITIAPDTFSGRARERLATSLLAGGAEAVTVTGRHPGRAIDGTDFVAARPDNRDSMRQAASGADVLIWRLPTPRRGVSDLRGLWARSIDVLVDTVVLEDVRHVVHLSHFGAWRKTGSRLVDTIADAEARIDEAAIHSTHVRAGFLLENLLLQVPTLRRGGTLQLPTLDDTPLPVVTSRDVVDELVRRALDKEPQGRNVVDLAGADRTTTSLLLGLSEGLEMEVGSEGMSADVARGFFESLGTTAAWADMFVESLVETTRGNVVAESNDRPWQRGYVRDWAHDVLAPRMTPEPAAG
jgi:uncharacterized protein YbjT (DUF2867 family)